jgi:hypothetical protein
MVQAMPCLEDLAVGRAFAPMVVCLPFLSGLLCMGDLALQTKFGILLGVLQIKMVPFMESFPKSTIPPLVKAVGCQVPVLHVTTLATNVQNSATTQARTMSSSRGTLGQMVLVADSVSVAANVGLRVTMIARMRVLNRLIRSLLDLVKAGFPPEATMLGTGAMMEATMRVLERDAFGHAAKVCNRWTMKVATTVLE